MNTFSATIRDFITTSKAAGMQKVLIDLQQNYGGDTLLAFDAFKQFFPQIDPYGGSWLRAHPPANIIGDTITTYWNNLTSDFDDFYALYNSEWVSSDRINAATNQNFTSWQQFFGPQQLNGDNFTTVVSSLLDLISATANNINSNDTTWQTSSLIRYHWMMTKASLFMAMATILQILPNRMLQRTS